MTQGDDNQNGLPAGDNEACYPAEYRETLIDYIWPCLDLQWNLATELLRQRCSWAAKWVGEESSGYDHAYMRAQWRFLNN